MYDKPVVMSYHYSAVDYGAGTVTRKIRIPKGAKMARVLDIHAFATETFTNTTLQGRTQVGISGDLDKYADMPMGVLAAAAALNFAGTGGGFVAMFQDHVDDVSELIVTFVAPTGGTPAGIADVDIAIAWDFVGL